MRLAIRETGSILLPARKHEVMAILQRTLRDGALVAPDRLEGAGQTYIVRDAPQGTRVIHARSEAAAVPMAAKERDELRRAVEADLFRLQKAFEMAPR